MTDVSPSQVLAEAVKRLGGQIATARLVGVSQQSVSKWLIRGKPLPAEHVLTVAKATGLSPNELRPDLYPAGLTFAAPIAPTEPAGLEAAR